MGKIKILFFHFDLGEGGAERVLVNLLNHLDKEKYEITLRTIFSGDINRKNLSSDIKFKPLFNRKPFHGTGLFFKLFPAKWINRILIKGKYDYQIAFLEHLPTRIVGASPPKENEKKFAWIHISADNPKSFTECFRSYAEFKEIYTNFNKIAFVSKKALTDFEKYHNIDTPKYVVHNVNDFEKIKTLSSAQIDIKRDENKINIISLGRLTRQKRFDRLIIALANLKKEGFNNWHLFLLGKGELENELKELTVQNNVLDDISFLGFQDNPYKFLSKMDLFVCSSEREGFSTAVTEAAFLGIPVVSTDCAGIEEIIVPNQNGIITDNSYEGLLQGLKSFLTLEQKDRENLKKTSREMSIKYSTAAAIEYFERFIGTLA